MGIGQKHLSPSGRLLSVAAVSFTTVNRPANMDILMLNIPILIEC